MNKTIIRTFYLITGFLSLLLGIIGAFLPVLPTTCFVLFAAFCFSKSSDRMHRYLINHPMMGSTIKRWQEYGEIPFRIKVIASFMMMISVSYPLLFIEFSYHWKLVIVAIVVSALVYIWTRPSEGVTIRTQQLPSKQSF